MLPYLKVMKKKGCPKMKKRIMNGKNYCRKSAFYQATKKIIFGKWAIPAHAGLALKFMWTADLTKNEKIPMEKV